MLLQQHRVRRGVVIDHVDHALHAAPVDFLCQGSEVLHCAVGRVHAAIVTVRIGAAEAAFLSHDADGVNRHEPDDIRPQRFDPVQIRNDGKERPLFGMCPDIYGINHLLLQVDVGVSRHDEPPARRYRYYTPAAVPGQSGIVKIPFICSVSCRTANGAGCTGPASDRAGNNGCTLEKNRYNMYRIITKPLAVQTI